MLRPVKPWPYPLWIAHRGGGSLAPENTLAAFRTGMSRGFRCFECDVKLSADGVPFLLHDATLERTTDGQGVAGRLAWRELARLDAGGWHSPRFAGEPLARLDDVAAYLLREGASLNIEIKPTPGSEGETGRVVANEAAALWRGSAHLPPLLSSFQVASLEAAREVQPHLPRALILDELRPGWFEQALALQCVAVVLSFRLVDQAMVARLHAWGMAALAFTVNEPHEAQRLLAVGIDGIVTDAIDRFQPGDRATSGSRR
jgi:glycerophosphoryl diester phosphodiesterase